MHTNAHTRKLSLSWQQRSKEKQGDKEELPAENSLFSNSLQLGRGFQFVHLLVKQTVHQYLAYQVKTPSTKYSQENFSTTFQNAQKEKAAWLQTSGGGGGG